MTPNALVAEQDLRRRRPLPSGHQSQSAILRAISSCLSLVSAVLDLVINHVSNGIRFTELDRQRLYQTRYQPAESEAPKKVIAA